MTDEELFKRIDADLTKKRNALIIHAIMLIIRLLVEIAIAVAVIWLCFKVF